MIRRHALALGLVAIGVGSAAAQRPAQPPAVPFLLPLQDVTVTYRVRGPALATIPLAINNTLRLTWDARGKRVRAESVAGGDYAIVNLPRRTAVLVVVPLHAAVELPLVRADLQPVLQTRGTRFQRRQTARIANVDCTDWLFSGPRANGTVCLSADGVALRGEGSVNGQSGSFEATDVDFGPSSDGAFLPPMGYVRLSFDTLRTLGGTVRCIICEQ